MVERAIEEKLTGVVRQTLARHNMLPAAECASESAADPAPELATEPAASVQLPIVLMVSGGSDSVALAHLLPRLLPAHSCTILHVNHLLRGVESDEDERFVRALAESLDTPCEIRRIDVAARAAEQGAVGNVEQVGRQQRYRVAHELLDQLCAEAGTDPQLGRIAVAHTQDDRVETYLMRVIVGGGTSGLASIPAVNGRVIRPLLDCTRAQLREWLAARSWRDDRSNEDTRHARAFVRHELIPLLQTRNPDVVATIARSLEVLTAEDAYLKAQTEQLCSRFLKTAFDGSVRLAPAFFKEDPVFIRRVIREACIRAMPEAARITFAHIEKIATRGAHVGFATDIPGDVTVRNVYGTLIFRQKTASEQPKHQPER
ncbi:MAG: tRNA lysidine(34) synthetase TilS [Coriobacteriales bacterium]|jgi:tRNA(Ile)-lysidine synthase|nr:tRNA lysidine(34) synthetase TilS [Coriobacteriales bacterium]